MTLEMDRTAPTLDADAALGGRARWTRSPWGRRLGALGATVLVAAGGWSAWEWHRNADDLRAMRQRSADAERAAAVARDYATKSLTYDFHRLDAFFDSVRAGTTGALADRYTTVHDTLGKIMTDAQVIARGEVTATAVTPGDNGVYTVTVFASQTTQNVQHPDPVTASTLLTVTVQHADGRWLVSDYHAR
ncbi:hypothetical protein [Nocardia pseudobrasiliensis]|uniref:Mce-associated membrane protein n=1 Tax=Nocardia pseudobrasiliensis TaxID=45979 RepID=A0A370HRY5_9NOCA|nr:hypothetical protein [Nocardia pseudobrasiliensis]RDI61296.1 Mce-associated membrane protein [Nocardia pseudobrasiliensis]